MAHQSPRDDFGPRETGRRGYRGWVRDCRSDSGVNPHEALVLALLLITIFQRLRRNNGAIGNGDNHEQALLVEWGTQVPDSLHPQAHERG